MSWKDKLRQGTFRGVPFFIDASGFGGGRRGVTHEFPGRDTPYREDLGRKSRSYKVDLYLLGADYLGSRDQLITALEQSGSGVLVHPYYGNVTVCVDGEFTVQENSREGGFVKISVPFVEAGRAIFPQATPDSGYQVSSASDTADSSSNSFLTKALNVASQPQFVIDSCTAKISSFADKISSYTNSLTGTASSIAGLAVAVSSLKSSVKQLILTPQNLANAMQNAMSLLIKAGNPNDVLAAATGMFSFGSADAAISATTSALTAQAAALSAINSFVQASAVTAAARSAVAATFNSFNDAAAMRDLINGQIDTIMLGAISDDLYTSLQALQAQVSSGVPSPSQALNVLATTTIPSETNMLSFLYDYYGSIDFETDVISRNDIRHPGLVPAGATLQVLDASS